MKTGRDDYNHAVHMSRIPADEPTFLTRAQDEFAARTTRFWAALAYNGGADDALVELSLQQADAQDAWPIKKIPDADHIPEHQRKHLRWLLSRRLWSKRITYNDQKIDELFAALTSLPETDQREFQGRLREHLSNTPIASRIWHAMDHAS